VYVDICSNLLHPFKETEIWDKLYSMSETKQNKPKTKPQTLGIDSWKAL